MYLGTVVKADLLFDTCLFFLIQVAHVVDPHRDGGFVCVFLYERPEIEDGRFWPSRAHGLSMDSALFRRERSADCTFD